MKKVRIMLAAIAILGVVGGALAFKAKTFGQIAYCYKTQTSGTCSTTIPSFPDPQRFVGVGTIYYTVTTIPTRCTSAVCNSSALTFQDE